MDAESILIIGAGGLLGQALLAALGPAGEAVPGGRSGLDLTSEEDELARRLGAARSGLVINCVGYTGVDRAESEPQAAMAVNAAGAGRLAAACARTGKHLVHLSTDYVFDGLKETPYREDDPAEPLSAYGRSKLEGERLVQKALPSALVVRSAWLFGHGKASFVDKVIAQAQSGGEAKVVSDEVGCPTYAADLAGALISLARRRVPGLLHVANLGRASRFELARQAVRLAGLDPDGVLPITARELGRPAPRPAYSVLETRRFARLQGGPLPRWLDALERYLAPKREETS